MWIIVATVNGWCLADLDTKKIVDGPFKSYDEAVEHAAIYVYYRQIKS